LNLWFLYINRSMSEWICPKCQKKRRLDYVMTTYLRQHGLMRFCLYNYEFWLSLCKIVRSSVILLLPLFIKHSRKVNKFAFCEFCRTATECTILRPSVKKIICSWFYHTIFKVLTTQILYPKCSRMQHFAFFWKKDPPLLSTAFSLSRVGMYVLSAN
jgi:hypothetical protein